MLIPGKVGAWALKEDEHRRKTLPRTPPNKGKRKRGRFSYQRPVKQHELDFEDRSIRYSSLRGGCGRVGFFRPVVLVA
jgi:hypothetical protein